MIKKYLDFTGLTEFVNKLKSFFQKKEFTGTHDEWNQLTPTEKANYEIVNFTDDEDPAYTVVDSVTNGDMHAVTSNAVYGQVYHKMGGIASSSITDVNVFTTFEDYAQANRWVFGNFPFSGTCTNLPGDAAAMNTYCWMYKSGGGTMKVRLMDCYTHNEWVTQKVGGVWTAWQKLITEANLNDWEQVTITMESGYANEIGTPEVYWSPSRKQLFISKLDAHPTSGDWVGGTPFCRFTRPSGFSYNVWGLNFYANVYWPSGAFYPISCNIWNNPNDGNDLGFALSSIDLAPANYSISNLNIRIMGVSIQGI